MAYAPIRGILREPLKILVYGVAGVGKTTFAAQFPGAVFIDTEGSTARMDVVRYIPKSWAELLETTKHVFKAHAGAGTLILDTADFAEILCRKQICDAAPARVKGIEDFGYGKGYTYAYEEFCRYLNLLDEARASGLTTLIIAHGRLEKVETPENMSSYDKWAPKLDKQLTRHVINWCDMALFANYETVVVTRDDGKAKAQGGKKRVMYTSDCAHWTAKNRFGLPDKLPFEYAQISHIVEENMGESRLQALRAAAEPRAETAASASGAQDDPREKLSLAEADSYKGIPETLLRLMNADGVKPFEIMWEVGKKGVFPGDMPIRDYDPEYIDACLVGAWEQVLACVERTRRETPF